MAGFEFQLGSVLKLRERARDIASQMYEQALTARSRLDEQIAELQQLRDAQRPYQKESSSGVINPQNVLDSQRYQMQLTQEVQAVESQRDLVEAECEKRRLLLVDREKEVRSLEKLRERQLAEWNASQAKQQQITLDQWAGFRYWESEQLDSKKTHEGQRRTNPSADR